MPDSLVSVGGALTSSGSTGVTPGIYIMSSTRPRIKFWRSGTDYRMPAGFSAWIKTTITYRKNGNQ
jgi:hypothetical protein